MSRTLSTAEIIAVGSELLGWTRLDTNSLFVTEKLAALETGTTDQLVVVTVSSLQDQEIEDYGYQLGRAWGIGQKENDNGALLIVAPNERKVRVEVGYGLEPILTDAFSSQVIRDDILPSFRDGDYQAGVVKGVDALIAQLSLDPAEAQARAQVVAAQQADTKGESILPMIISKSAGSA